MNTVQRAAYARLIEETEFVDGMILSSAGACVAPCDTYTAIREGFDAGDRPEVLLA